MYNMCVVIRNQTWAASPLHEQLGQVRLGTAATPHQPSYIVVRIAVQSAAVLLAKTSQGLHVARTLQTHTP